MSFAGLGKAGAVVQRTHSATIIANNYNDFFVGKIFFTGKTKLPPPKIPRVSHLV